jgi:hypothetical protein
MRNITAPRTVSFEEALRNLASRLTGVSASSLPRTQEGVVQFMAENLPPAIDVDGLAEAVTAEVIARLGKDAAEVLAQMDTGTAETTEDAPNLTADGTKATEATEDTTGTQNGSQKATGAAKRNKTKSTD